MDDQIGNAFAFVLPPRLRPPLSTPMFVIQPTVARFLFSTLHRKLHPIRSPGSPHLPAPGAFPVFPLSSEPFPSSRKQVSPEVNPALVSFQGTPPGESLAAPSMPASGQLSLGCFPSCTHPTASHHASSIALLFFLKWAGPSSQSPFQASCRPTFTQQVHHVLLMDFMCFPTRRKGHALPPPPSAFVMFSGMTKISC